MGCLVWNLNSSRLRAHTFEILLTVDPGIWGVTAPTPGEIFSLPLLPASMLSSYLLCGGSGFRSPIKGVIPYVVIDLSYPWEEMCQDLPLLPARVFLHYFAFLMTNNLLKKSF